MKYSVETNALAIGYGKAALARDIALGAAKGQVLALIGPNGAGKSTLLKTLAGQLAPLGGAVLLDGQELARIPGNARAQKLALMLPHTRRTELTTCFEFAAAGRIPYTGRLGILSAEDKKQVQNALELVGAAHLANRDFNCVSDGQRQRILLARAVCQQPQVLLLDEPTSFLDIKGKIELLTILQKLAHEQQLAVIVTLHELDMAQKIADAVVCVFPHSVSGVLTPKEAFAPENIRVLYSLTKEQYEAVFGPEKPAGPKFEHYVRSGQKLLRCGSLFKSILLIQKGRLEILCAIHCLPFCVKCLSFFTYIRNESVERSLYKLPDLTLSLHYYTEDTGHDTAHGYDTSVHAEIPLDYI